MTNFILNLYSTLIEILLWLVVVSSTIGGAAFGLIVLSPALLSANDEPRYFLGAVLGMIVGVLVGIIICLFFVGPLMLLVNIRDHFKTVLNDTSLIIVQTTEINRNLKR